MKEARLKVVDGFSLPEEYRELLRPGELMTDAMGDRHVLPRFFYRVDSWRQAKETKLAPHFALAELMTVDARESALLLETFPHYVPCAVAVLSLYLESLRQVVGEAVFISANGGYRSPAHGLSGIGGPHNWGTAVNIYRIGDLFLNEEKGIEKFGRIARSVGAGVYVKPFGHGEGQSDDHLHVDIGYVSYVPRGCDEESGRRWNGQVSKTERS